MTGLVIVCLCGFSAAIGYHIGGAVQATRQMREKAETIKAEAEARKRRAQ